MENQKQSLVSFGIILGISIIISFSAVSYAVYKIKNSESISVTGSAKKAVTSDKVKWTSNITRTVRLSSLKDGYAKIDSDLKEVKAFLETNGIPETNINISPIFMNEMYDSNSQAEKTYNLTQTIEIQSNDVNKITELSKNTSALIINKGVIFSTLNLEYYYSKLPEMRVTLLPDAIADAKARAEKLASAGGRKIGSIKSASSGVVQVLAPNSIDVSDYGMYDTSKIEKEIMVTVKASFELK